MRKNVEEIFALVKSYLSLMATILFHVAKLSYESRSTLLRLGMNVLKRFVHGKNVFVNLPTKQRACVIPISGSGSTIVI